MGIFDFLATMTGPDFLVLFVIWLVLTRMAVAILRGQGYHHPLITLGGLALFEGLGGLRIFVGSAHGLHRWGFLTLLMIVGFLVFLFRARDFGNRPSGGSCSGAISSGGSCSGSGGGGCGGGSGCGGGGCGGCGGS